MGFLKKLKSSRSVSSKSSKKSKKLSRSHTSPTRNPPDQVYLNYDDDGGGQRSLSCSYCISLATGSFTLSGVTELSLSGASGRSPSPFSSHTDSVGSSSDGDSDDRDGRHDNNHPALDAAAVAKLSPIKEVLLVTQRRPSRIFIRTADLPQMKRAANQLRRSSFSELSDDDLIDHVHKPSSNPPLPDMERDPNESWVALDDGDGRKAPLAEAAVAALVQTALGACMDREMWTANGGTAKLLKSGLWEDTVFSSPSDDCGPVPVPHERGSKGENDVLVWSGAWSHEYYGHDLPAIRCEAIVNMSPRRLADLLVDSSRVKEYNKMSIGRDDVIVLQEEDERVTKISVARTKPPMVSKTLVLKNLLHMEELPGGGRKAGYVIASRAVAHADDAEAVEDLKVVHSEMLMGLNVIRAVEGEVDRCILINLNHLRSPMIPMMFAKKLGLSAAVNFINDIRALC